MSASNVEDFEHGRDDDSREKALKVLAGRTGQGGFVYSDARLRVQTLHRLLFIVFYSSCHTACGLQEGRPRVGLI